MFLLYRSKEENHLELMNQAGCGWSSVRLSCWFFPSCIPDFKLVPSVAGMGLAAVTWYHLYMHTPPLSDQ
jgi:hypothetical protein